MATESEIYEDIKPFMATHGDFHDFKLLRATKYANIFLALRDGKRFLIKTTKDNSSWQCRLLRREYELSISVDHPHIVRTYALEEFEAYGIGIVMEYVDGRTLREYLDERPSRKELLRIFDELLAAVEYLHCRSIIHNDLKPENILITRVSNTLKLIDFGLADSDVEYAMRELGCTPEYASAELRSQRAEIDARSDIYSLGVVMCELFGSSPIARRSTAEDVARRYANVAHLRRAWYRYRVLRYIVAAFLLAVAVAMSIFISIDANQQVALEESATVEQQRAEPLDEQPIVDTLSRPMSSGESGVMTQQKIEKRLEQKIERPVVETLLQQLDGALMREYNIVADSVAKAVYMEFAYRHISTLWERGEAACQSAESKATSVVDRALLRSHYDGFMLRHYQMLMERASKLPSVYLDLDGSLEEFYHQLLNEGLPYRPYSEE